jgi:S-DNA-T family DNA segregation ATPase FtsK/SpoIIIE
LKTARGAAVKKILNRPGDIGAQLGVDPPMIGIEDGVLLVDVPCVQRADVSFSRVEDVLPAPDLLQGSSKIPLGVDLTHQIRCVDLAAAERVLVIGMTDSGKTEWLRTAIASLLIRNTPGTLRLWSSIPRMLDSANSKRVLFSFTIRLWSLRRMVP